MRAKTSKAKAPKPKTAADRLADLAERHVRALEVGKAGYHEADEALDQISALVPAGTEIQVGKATFVLVDRFAQSSKVGYGGAARRYRLDEKKASDVTGRI
jgi:hypothetical protein